MKKLVWAAGAALVVGGIAMAAPAPKEIVTTQNKDLKWAPLDPKDTAMKGPKMSIVFGDAKKGPVGFILWVPPGFKAGPHTHTSDDYATIISGTVHNFKAPGTDTGPALTAGSTWMQPGGQPHDNYCEESSKDGCQIFVYMAKGFDFKPWTDPKAPKAPAPKK
jgi:uncharacterized protein DUF4437